MKHRIGVLTAFGIVFLAASGQATGPEAATAGSAAGTMKANGKEVTLRFAQARKAGKDWEVLLSDVPTAFSQPDERGLVESGKLHSLTLTIGADGAVSYWRMAHNAIEARFFSTSSVSSSKATKLGPAVVEGQAKMTSATYGATTMEFDVTFNAPLGK